MMVMMMKLLYGKEGRRKDVFESAKQSKSEGLSLSGYRYRSWGLERVRRSVADNKNVKFITTAY